MKSTIQTPQSKEELNEALTALKLKIAFQEYQSDALETLLSEADDPSAHKRLTQSEQPTLRRLNRRMRRRSLRRPHAAQGRKGRRLYPFGILSWSNRGGRHGGNRPRGADAVLRAHRRRAGVVRLRGLRQPAGGAVRLERLLLSHMDSRRLRADGRV